MMERVEDREGGTNRSAAEGTFSAGSAAYAMSTLKAGSHRTSSFSAIVQ
jgi:hypothetical protein